MNRPIQVKPADSENRGECMMDDGSTSAIFWK